MLTFCPTCQRWHNPEANCVDGAGSALREIGIKPKKMPEEEFKALNKKANKILIIIALFLIGLIVISYFISNFSLSQ